MERLGARTAVDMLDMKKIWKGLFYAMWHADGWDVQAEVAEQMASAMHKLKHRVALVGPGRHCMPRYMRHLCCVRLSMCHQ
jgi:hypothetical protein